MLFKYLIDEDILYIDDRLQGYIEEKYRYNYKEVKKSWFHVSSDKKNLLSGLLYFELQKDLKGIFDFSILKRETLEVIEFIKETFNIRKDLIRIYFNGENGFY